MALPKKGEVTLRIFGKFWWKIEGRWRPSAVAFFFYRPFSKFWFQKLVWQKKSSDATRPFQFNATARWSNVFKIRHVARKVNKPLCTDLLRTTLNAVNYKTCSDGRNQFSTLGDLVRVTSGFYKDKHNQYE